MHQRRITLQTPLILFAAIFCCGTATYAAEKELKTTPPATTAKAATTAPSAQEVIARVNSKPIYAIELRRAKKVIMAGQPGLQIPADRQKEFDLQALNQIISAELLYQAGQKLEIKDIDKQIADKISQSKSRFPNEQEFDKSIQTLEMSVADLNDYTRRDIVIANFIQQTFASKVSISDDESKKFYDQNIDKFKQSESVKASHILVCVDSKAAAEVKKKAHKKAEKLRKDLTGGADFAKLLAKENATCPSSKQGGDLGFIGKGMTVPAFEQAAFALKPGEFSNVVETPFGYHIIKVTDKKGAETIVYKDAKSRIEDYLKNQKIGSQISTLLDEKRKNAKIEILLK